MPCYPIPPPKAVVRLRIFTMKIKEQSLALCHAIEAAGASEALTTCSVLASHLYAEAERLSDLSERMKRFVAENYPPNEKGQVDFVRALVEGYADEIVNPPA